MNKPPPLDPDPPSPINRRNTSGAQSKGKKLQPQHDYRNPDDGGSPIPPQKRRKQIWESWMTSRNLA